MIAANLVFMALNPLPQIMRLSLYNTLVPGRARLPYAENTAESYNVTLLNLEGMLASHEVSATPADSNEYRVFMIGDSAAWGWLLEPSETLAACLNHQQLKTRDGRLIRVYNLGYPILNATKDLLILDAAREYDPDMVIWMMTLVSLFPGDQLYHAIVRAHPEQARQLIQQYDLPLDPQTLPQAPDKLDRSLVGQRRLLADWLRLQVYGLAWAMTGVDHRNPKFFTPVQQNLYGGEVLFDGQAQTLYDEPYVFQRDDLALDVLSAGVTMTESVGAKMLIINEPIYRSSGVESDLRYNFYYPRWAYDAYRVVMEAIAREEGWSYLDLWDAAPPDQFTDSSLHLTPSATCELAVLIGAAIEQHAP